MQSNRDDRTNYSHGQPWPLDAEVLRDAICDVTGVPEVFARAAGFHSISRDTNKNDEGHRDRPIRIKNSTDTTTAEPILELW